MNSMTGLQIKYLLSFQEKVLLAKRIRLNIFYYIGTLRTLFKFLHSRNQLFFFIFYQLESNLNWLLQLQEADTNHNQDLPFILSP